MKQHKWHKEIKAWADGTEIQERYIPDDDIWITLKEDDEPLWHCNDYEYRIKPQPKDSQYLYVWNVFNKIVLTQDKNSIVIDTWDPSVPPRCIGKIKIEVEDERPR